MFHVEQILKDKHPEFEKLYALQEEYNKHTNITRITSKEDYYTKHIADSLALLEFLPESGSLIDVGTGGGYPGIPLAIANPKLQITLNDSIQKKTRYLEQAAAGLGLKNTSVIWGRSEALGQNSEYRECFDIATARAVAQTNILLELLSPLVKVGGQVLIMKARDAEKEATEAQAAAKTLDLEYLGAKKYSLLDNERQVLIYKKTKPTPANYPRNPGIPEKKPLA